MSIKSGKLDTVAAADADADTDIDTDTATHTATDTHTDAATNANRFEYVSKQIANEK